MTNFRPMRRKRQLLSEEESIKILLECSAGTLALLGDDGYPYSLPISYVYSDNKLFFHSALKGHKIDAIEKYKKASFSVIQKDDVKPSEFTTYYRSVICFGTVRIVDDENEKMRYIRLLSRKYNPHDEHGLEQEIKKDFHHMCMICFDIEYMTGKESIELVKEKEE